MKFFLFIIVVLFSSCGSSESQEETVAQVGDEKLYRSAISAQLPKGLDISDSTALSNAFIAQWIQEQVLKMEAEKIPTPLDLEQKIDRYKNQLLIQGLKDKVVSERLSDNQQMKKDSSQTGMSEEVLLENRKWTIWEEYQKELLKKYEADGLIKKP